ncbi:MAG: hypothetical protein AAFY72_17245 [Cyanobacteria bacterium J06649_4]
MRSPETIATKLIICTATLTTLMNSGMVNLFVLNSSCIYFSPPAFADTRLRGSFEYNLDEQTLSEWELGPVFSLGDSLDLEMPIGQNDGEWRAIVELIYELEVNDGFDIEFSTGLEANENEPIESFGNIEGSWNW